MSTALLYLFITLSWGGSYLAIRYVVEGMPPLFGALARVTLAGLVMSLLLHRRLWQRSPSRRVVRLTIISGFFSMGASWGLLFWGELHVAPAVTAIIIGATPIFTTLFLPFIDPERRVTRRQWYGVLLGFAGLLLIFGPQLHTGPTSELLGLLAILGTAILYGVGTGMQQPLSRHIGGRFALFYQCVGSLLILVPAVAATSAWPAWSTLWTAPRPLYALAYLAFSSTVLAFLCWFSLIRRIGSIAASTTTYCVPLVSLWLDALILRQVPAWNVLAGAIAILGSVALSQRSKTLPRAEPQPARAVGG